MPVFHTAIGDQNAGYLEQQRADAEAYSTKAFLRASYHFLRVLSLLAEDLTDTVTQDLFPVSDNPGWNLFVNYILPFVNLLIWLIQVVQNAIEYYYAVTSKVKRAILLMLSIIGAITGIVVVIATFFSFVVGAVAALPLFIALGAAVLALRMGFYLYLSYKKTKAAYLLKDIKNKISALRIFSKMKGYLSDTAPSIKNIRAQQYWRKKDNADSAPFFEKLLCLSLREQALIAVEDGHAVLWQTRLVEDLLQYEKEKYKERKLEMLLVSTVAVGSFLLMIPTPVTTALGGILIIGAALLSISWAIFQFCRSSFIQWQFEHRVKNFSQFHIASLNDGSANNHDFLKISYLSSIGLTNYEDQENYWMSLPESMRVEKRIAELARIDVHSKKENRGASIMKWYGSELFKQPKAIEPSDSYFIMSWRILKEACGFILKKIIFLALLAPICAVAATCYALDRKKACMEKTEDKTPLLALRA